MLGYQFRRERPILNSIVDFVCLEIMLVIEVDGWNHTGEKDFIRDQNRDKILSEIGFTVLHFSSWEVLNRIADVSIIISSWIEENAMCEPLGKRNRKQKGDIPPLCPLKGEIADI